MDLAKIRELLKLYLKAELLKWKLRKMILSLWFAETLPTYLFNPLLPHHRCHTTLLLQYLHPIILLRLHLPPR